jgi:hypothetical protein
VVYPKAEKKFTHWKKAHENPEILDQVFDRKAHRKPTKDDSAGHHTEPSSSLHVQYLELEV